ARRGSIRNSHRAGEKRSADSAGQSPRLIEPTTGEVIEVDLFVAVLGASTYTSAEASRTQQVPEWITSHAAGLRLLRRGHGRHRVRSAQERRRPTPPLRAGPAAHLRRVCRALRHPDSATPPRPSPP